MWVVTVLLLIAGVLGIAVWYLPLIHQNERMRKEVFWLDAQIHKEDQTSKQLKASIEALKYDTNALERVAREQLGYAKPGETVIHFETTETNSVARQAN